MKGEKAERRKGESKRGRDPVEKEGQPWELGWMVWDSDGNRPTGPPTHTPLVDKVPRDTCRQDDAHNSGKYK